MDFYNIISVCIAGALAGCAFECLTIVKGEPTGKGLFLKNNILKMILAFCFFGIFTGVATLPIIKTAVMTKIDQNYVVKEKIKLRIVGLLEIAKIKEKVKTFESAEEARAFSKKLESSGIKHLSNDELLLWNSIRLDMASLSPDVCSKFLTGVMNKDELCFKMKKRGSKSGKF